MTEETILGKLDRIPPFICRLLARTENSRRGLSHTELAIRSGLNRSTIRDLSVATSWRGCTIDTIMAYTAACGVNHLAARRQLDFLKRRKWQHVESATGNQARLYRRLMILLVEEAKKRKEQPK